MKPPKPDDPARSMLMARVRQHGTKAEIAVAAELRKLGASYRLNVRSLPGSPYFPNQKRRWAVFVHGCFWHQHRACKKATVPKTNGQFWREKFLANRNRDARAIRELRRIGFHVSIIWECQIADPDVARHKLSKVLEPRRVYVAETIDH